MKSLTQSFRAQAALGLVGAALVVLVLALSAPGSSGGTSPNPHGDTWVEAMIGSPHLVNPLLATSDADVDLTHLVFSGLTRFDERGNLVPDLASGWEISDDGRVITFTLSPDARWHDGKPVSPADVVFTLGLLASPQFPGEAALAAPWRDVQAEEEGTDQVRLTLPAPDATFVEHTTVGILPRHLWGDVKPGELAASPLNRLPVGSGPWKYVGLKVPEGDEGGADVLTPTLKPADVPGLVLEPASTGKNPAKLARIWLRPYPNFGAALVGFRQGEVLGLAHIPADRLHDVESTAGVALHRQTLARLTMLVLNTRAPQFESADVRRAVEMAIDRDTLVRAALAGSGRPADSPVLPHSWAYSPTARHAAFDPAAAGRTLDAAGWRLGADGVRARGGLTMSVVLAANLDVPTNGAVASEIKKQLKQVGIEVLVALVPPDTLVKDYLGPRAFHMALYNWQSPGLDPDVYALWHSSQAQAPGLNLSGWDVPVADRALDSARKIYDTKSRATRYDEFQQAFARDVPAVVLFSPFFTYATRAPAYNVDLPIADILSPAQRFDTMGDWQLKP